MQRAVDAGLLVHRVETALVVLILRMAAFGPQTM